MLNGIDLSAHNRATAQTLEGQDFVFNRACFGQIRDRKYDYHYRLARDAGIVAGAYLFLGPAAHRGSPEKQVDKLLEVADGADLFVVDWERDKGIGFDFGTAPTSERLRAIAHLKAAGVVTGTYASLSGFPWHDPVDFWWVAAYDGLQLPVSKVISGRTFHQYSGNGLDRNHFFGNLDDLRTLARIPIHEPIPLPPTEATPEVRFISANNYDVSSLPRVRVPAGTIIADLAGKDWGKVKVDTVLATTGLGDAHGNQRVVSIVTGRYSQGIPWRVWQIVRGSFAPAED